MVEFSRLRPVNGYLQGIAAFYQRRHVKFPHSKGATGGIGTGDARSVEVNIGPVIEAAETKDGALAFFRAKTRCVHPGLVKDALVHGLVVVLQEKVFPKDAGLVERAGNGAGNAYLILLGTSLLLEGPVGEPALFGSRGAGQKAHHGG